MNSPHLAWHFWSKETPWLACWGQWGVTLWHRWLSWIRRQLVLLLCSQGSKTGQESASAVTVYLDFSRTFVTQLHLCPQPVSHVCLTPGGRTIVTGVILLSVTYAANGAISSGMWLSQAGVSWATGPGLLGSWRLEQAAEVNLTTWPRLRLRLRPLPSTQRGVWLEAANNVTFRQTSEFTFATICAKESSESESSKLRRTLFILGGLYVYRFKKRAECNKPLIPTPKVMDAEF